MTNPLFVNTILLGGSSRAKIAAARTAGFDQIELWRQDVEAESGGAAGIVQALDGIGLTDFQVLMDFDGAPGARRDAKRRDALQMLDLAAQLGAGTVLTPASTDPDCDAARIVDDLVWLAQQAAVRQLRIAYEGMAWSTINHTTPSAWRSVQQAGQSNLGMVIDAFHIFAARRDASDIDGIPADRIFLVQLSDLDHAVEVGQLVETARHHRLLPGAGCFPLDSLLQRLKAIGYAGPIGLEVFNDAMKARNPMTAAHEAMIALRSICEKNGLA
ncbi:sugar phosphate isomerase/epimerase family protein [Massilia aurea]|uniref:sugar phosphate isomerase/epimerase family protein n=1 Tax=Massilia aurea TaxID=373040 RepID=UPI0034619E5F